MQTALPDVLTPDLLAFLRQRFRLNWNGLHGWSHWLRVYENGMHIALQNNADQVVVTLFAFTHDLAREQEGWDRKHGPRAAKLIQSEMQGRFFTLPDAHLSLLVEAVRLHTEGLTEADPTVQTCWDADRLDLWRAGYRPSPKHLCTPEARDPQTIAWAVSRSEAWRRGP